MKLPFAGRLLAVALFAAASFSLPLAHADSPTPPKIGLVMKSLANEFFVTMTKGAEGVGLLRSEFLFMERTTAPTEAEQAAVYADDA